MTTEHFERIRPIVGPWLDQAEVAVWRLPAAAGLVAYLAASGVRRWRWDGEPAAQQQMQALLQAQHGQHLALDCQAFTQAEPPSLMLAVGDGPTLAQHWTTLRRWSVPLVLALPPTAERAALARVVFVDDDTAAARRWLLQQAPGPWSATRWATAQPLIAGLARAVLLRDTPLARPDLLAGWQHGQRVYAWEHPNLPLQAWGETPPLGTPEFTPPATPRGTLLIAGLGSLGSVAACALAPLFEQLVLVDPDHVDAANPVRQAFPVSSVGQPKAQALAAQLAASTHGPAIHPSNAADQQRDLHQPTPAHDAADLRLPAPPAAMHPRPASTHGPAILPANASDQQRDLHQPAPAHDAADLRLPAPPAAMHPPPASDHGAAILQPVPQASAVPTIHAYSCALDAATTATLIAEHGVSMALVATGTAADFAIAAALRAANVPHIVGRCYPRAHYWEAIIVDGERGPAFDALRGHIRPGPSAAPTPEQRAAYSELGALEAEPATLIESGWAAQWLARLCGDLRQPQGLRPRYLLQLLHNEQTCLIGGTQVQPTAAGPAYQIEQPGQVRAWQRQNIRQAAAPGLQKLPPASTLPALVWMEDEHEQTD